MKRKPGAGAAKPRLAGGPHAHAWRPPASTPPEPEALFWECPCGALGILRAAGKFAGVIIPLSTRTADRIRVAEARRQDAEWELGEIHDEETRRRWRNRRRRRGL
jgi:hypothetical protein